MRTNTLKAIFLFLMLSVVGIFPAFAGEVIHMTGPRTLRVAGEIGPEALKMVSTIEEMSAHSALPIDIVINSPGGSVPAGLQLVEAVHIAQSRGVTVRCAVTTLAASMAFILLSQCDERMALANSLLLFHPARAFVFMGALKAEDARYMAEELEAINADMADMLEESMGIVTAEQKSWFDYHTKNETLWTASRLRRALPSSDWLTIVSDIQVEGNLFGGLSGSAGSDEAAVRNFLEQRSIP